MKAIAVACALIALAGLIAVVVIVRRRTRPKANPATATLELREKLLGSGPGQWDIKAAPGEAWGIVMDTGYPEATASLISLVDGTASLYFSNGGGMIGGQGQRPVQEAALEFVRTATKHLGALRRVSDHPLPEVGRTFFYVLTPEGLFSAEAAEEDLGEGRHALSPLFHAGQNVITEFRLVSEAMDP